MTISRRTFALASLLLAAIPGLASAQAYPTKPIKILVPFAAGGTTDIVARIVSHKLGQELGQPVIVDNRAGGGGTVGADTLAKSAPDGYTLGIATVSTIGTNPATNPNMPYDPIKDFTAIISLVNVPNVLTVNPNKVPAKDMKEFIALLKKNPDKYSYASSGSGGISHMDGEYFKILTGTSMVHIPYRGSGPALNDTIAGQVDAQMDNLPSSLPHIQAGKLRVLGVMAAKRVDALPDVPTFAELGLKDANNEAWYGLVAPANLPADIQRKLHAAAQKTLDDPEVRKRLTENGCIVDGGSIQDFEKKMRRELALRKEIVKRANIKLEQ
jgi:tripartite-type tricarboxylate transporter receptor subunit TctC